MNLNYKTGKVGRKFLKVMGIEHNFTDLNNPSIESLADLVAFDASLPQDDKDSFYFSVYNSCHYPRMAKEIMKKLFSDKESKLQELIAELERENPSLITSASSEVEETIKKCKNAPNQGIIEKMETDIVCEIFGQIPSHALNLLGLIKINPEKFSQSYISLEQMLKDFNTDGRHYDSNEIKGFFSKALEELEEVVKNAKKKSEPTNQDQSRPEKEEDTPTNPNEKPTNQNNSENNQTPNETNESPSSDLANLQVLKDQVISNITAALNQVPPLNNSDLPSEYQNWESEINHLTDENQINFFWKKNAPWYPKPEKRKNKKTNYWRSQWNNRL